MLGTELLAKDRKPQILAAVLAIPMWLVVAYGLFFTGCQSHEGTQSSAEDDYQEEQAHQDHDDHDDEDAVIRLTPAVLKEFGIEIGQAGAGRIERYVHLPGEVQPNGDRLAHIVPRFEGIVTDVRKGIGDHVQKGDVLAIVESDDSLAPYELKTLIGGTVIAKHVTQGEAVSREHETFVIADLTSVWVDFSVYQRDLARVKVGQSVQISTGESQEEAPGTISYVTPVVDEGTRTATARVVLGNPDGHWRPGMFVIGRVAVGNTEVDVAAPRTALETIDGQTVVFVETEEGLAARAVRLGQTGTTHVEILSGLEPGQRYVTRGGFTLKAELSKGAFGEGHAH